MTFEYRILRQLPWQDEPDVIGETKYDYEAKRYLKDATTYHDQMYLDSSVWMEKREVGTWRPCNG